MPDFYTQFEPNKQFLTMSGQFNDSALRQAQMEQARQNMAMNAPKVQMADQYAQAGLYGTPFEQQQARNKSELEGQNLTLRRLEQERANQQMLADLQYRQQVLSHQKAQEAIQGQRLDRQLAQDAFKNSIENWKVQKDAYEAGIGPDPGPAPSMGQRAVQQRPAPPFNPSGPDLSAQVPGGTQAKPIPSQAPEAKIQMPEDLMRLPPGARNNILKARITEQPMAESALSEAIANLDRMADKAANIKDNEALGNATGVVGLVARQIPGTEWKAIGADLESLKATSAFAMLNQLRSQSKTGGALGQVSNQEENMLSNAIAGLDPQMSVTDFKNRLAQIQRYTKGAKERLIDAYKRTYGVEPVFKEYHTVEPKQTPQIEAGTVMQGYRFKGGDPANKSNWEKAE